MTEQQNTALIQTLYDAFGRGDVRSILDNLAEDVQWGLEGPAIIPFAGRRKGRAQVQGFFEALGTTLHGMKLITEHFVAQGNLVASIGRFCGTVTATGKNFDVAVAHFFEIRDGKVARFVDFGDTAAWADAYTQTSAASR